MAHTEIPPAQLTCALRTLVHGTTLASSDATDGPQSTNGGSVCPPPCTCLHRRRHLNASGVSSSAVGQMASGLIEVRDLGGTPLVNIDYSHEHDRHLRSDPLPPPSRLTRHARCHACTLAGGRKALAVMTSAQSTAAAGTCRYSRLRSRASSTRGCLCCCQSAAPGRASAAVPSKNEHAAHVSRWRAPWRAWMHRTVRRAGRRAERLTSAHAALVRLRTRRRRFWAGWAA